MRVDDKLPDPFMGLDGKRISSKDAKTGKIDYSKNTEPINWKKSDWIDWETPTLN